MRVQVEAQVDNLRTTPRGFYWGERRIGIVEMIDQWYGPDYRYVKVKADDSGVYILRFAEITLIMFVSARSQALATQAA
jgi:hypothetical protein